MLLYDRRSQRGKGATTKLASASRSAELSPMADADSADVHDVLQRFFMLLAGHQPREVCCHRVPPSLCRRRCLLLLTVLTAVVCDCERRTFVSSGCTCELVGVYSASLLKCVCVRVPVEAG